MYSIEEKERIVRLYQAGKSGLEISLALKHGKNHVYRVLKEYGIKLDKKKKIEDNQKQTIVDRYNFGEDVKDLAKEFNVTSDCIRLILRKANVKMRWGTKVVSEELKDKIVELWNQNEFKLDIAHYTGLDIRYINKVLTERNINHSKLNVREHHGHWKGGKTISSYGYILRHVDRADEFYSMADNSGYILEHRYNMAKHLGRPLTSNETVHHKDGNPKNNDISNLQLRQGQHGKGQQFKCGDCGSHNVQPVEI